MVTESESNSINQLGDTAITIDAAVAEQLAKDFDFSGRDLQLHIDYEFPYEKAVNFVVIDPILFGTTAFVEVVDVATLNENQEFETVEGFDMQSFDKTLTPEANKVVSDEIVKATLAPSQYSYSGLGIFAFPVRVTTKVRVTLLMRDPVPTPYERLHVLTQEVTHDKIKMRR
jgi:hypothetical protein